MVVRQHRDFAELPITIDRAAGETLTEQIAGSLRDAIHSHTLRPGEPVPATRELSNQLRVARGVVVAAYAQLITEGYLTAEHGRGTRVHPGLSELHFGGQVPVEPAALNSDSGNSANTTLLPLTPGTPDTLHVNTPAWRGAWRQALTRADLESPHLGEWRLRELIAEHLRRMRATPRPAQDVIVTAGARDALSLLLTALARSKGRTLVVGVEDPGYASLRSVASAHGASLVPLAVDQHGLITHNLPEHTCDLVIVTPSHQYPLGASLPLARRQELLEWADRTGAVIVEDDYDSELRHVGSPLPALAALDDPTQGSVVLLGSFSKTVTPALSAGYLLASQRLRDTIEPVRVQLGGPVSAMVQAALVAYLESGEHRRHIAKMRRRYAHRRELVVEHLYGVSGAQVLPMSGGLHAVVGLENGTSEAEQKLHRESLHLGTMPLSSYWQGEQQHFGLVIGTGGSFTEAEFIAALQELKRIFLV